MNNIQSTLLDIQQLFENIFNQTGTVVSDPVSEQFNNPGWSNLTWESNLFRKAHVNIIDAMDTRGLWMMHCCIYPHYHNPAPIFGFDVFAGKNKITGCFHDFSPVVNDHPLSEWFSIESSKLNWNKKRELPEWAQRIFSNDIIAAGNVQSDDELAQISDMLSLSLRVYLSTLEDTNNTVDDISKSHMSFSSSTTSNLCIRSP